MDIGALRAHASPKPVFWAGVGTQLRSETTDLAEALQVSGLDFTVEKKPVSIILPDPEFPDDSERVTYITAKDRFATYRTDINRILGVVGSQYEVLQNYQCFDFVDDLVKQCGGTYSTAGAFGGGERIFISIKLPNVIALDDDDIIDQYFFITTSHDGTSKVTVGFTNIRIICQNTLNMAIAKAKNRIDIKHTSSMHDRLDIAKTIIYEQTKYYREFQDLMNRLKGVSLPDSEVRKAMCHVVLQDYELESLHKINYQYEESRYISTKKANVLTDILTAINLGVGQHKHKGTGLWLLNGITTYYQNEREFKTNDAKFAFFTDRRYNEAQNRTVNYLLSL